MTVKVKRNQIRKDMYRTNGGKCLHVGIWIDDEPYYLTYDETDLWDELITSPYETTETLAINHFVKDLETFYGKALQKKGIEIQIMKGRKRNVRKNRKLYTSQQNLQIDRQPRI